MRNAKENRRYDRKIIIGRCLISGRQSETAETWAKAAGTRLIPGPTQWNINRAKEGPNKE